MRRLVCCFCIVCIGLLLSSAVFGERVDQIVAIVNEDIITADELDLFIKITRAQGNPQLAEVETSDLRGVLLERVVEDRLILQEAKRRGIKVDESMVSSRIQDIRRKAGGESAFQEALLAEDITIGELKKKIRNQLLIYLVVNRQVKSRVTVSPKEVTDYFESHRSMFMAPETLDVDSLFVESRRDLEEVQEALRNGRSFQELIAQYSKKSNLGLVRRGQLKKDLDEILFKLKENQPSQPVEVDGGFYIFLVKKKTSPAPRTIEEVKESVSLLLENQKVQMRLREWLEDLKAEAYISVRLR